MPYRVLFVMTQLISPIGGDPDVRRMLLQLEFQRRPPPDVPSGIRVFELPPKPETQRTSDSSTDERDLPERPERIEYGDDDVETTQDHVIDWWAQARAVIQDLGPMPSSGDPTMPTEQGNSGSGYRNVYGDLEVPISESCVMQMQSRPFDSSDFARNIPPRIVCKGTSKMDLSGLDEYLDKRRTK